VRALLDTSAIVAEESRGADLIGYDDLVISAMTIGELALGVAMARDPDRFATRRHTLLRVRDAYDVIELDDEIATIYGDIMGRARSRGLRPGVPDALIAATAIRESLPVLTQDVDFLSFDGLEVVLV
jgi:predicted nucleic acid-binding protein